MDAVAPQGGALPKLSFVGPILATIFCCLIGGIVSIIYTAKGNTAAATGNTAEYDQCVKNRKGWLVASVVIGLVVVVIQVVVVVSQGGLSATP